MRMNMLQIWINRPSSTWRRRLRMFAGSSALTGTISPKNSRRHLPRTRHLLATWRVGLTVVNSYLFPPGRSFLLRTGTPWRDCRCHGPYTIASIAGQRWASGFEYSKRWRRDHRSHWDWSTHRLSALTSMRRALKRGPDNAIGRSRGGLSARPTRWSVRVRKELTF